MDKYGVIGYPLGHTFSPQIHNPAFKALGIRAKYEAYAIAPDDFDQKITSLKEGVHKGFNVTVPYKQRIIPFIDEIEPLAQKVNAVNTIKKIDGGWLGYNTDLYGFLLPITDYLHAIKNVLVIGAGGASNAVCFALLDLSHIEHLSIVNRTIDNARLLRDRLNKFYRINIGTSSLDAEVNTKFDLIVNTTSVGLGNTTDKNPFDIRGCYHNDTIVYDLIYNPQETLFLQKAKRLKLETINGLDMLIGQAAKSFFIWTGREFPDTIIDKTIFYK